MDLRLPSRPDGIVIPNDVTPKYIPVRLRRKIFVINDRMAVGAAGTVYHIQRLIGDLRQQFCHTSCFSYDDVRGYLRDYPSMSTTREEALNSVSAVILVEASDGRGSLVVGRRYECMSRFYGKVISLGSGANVIMEEIRRFDEHYIYGLSVPSDPNNKFPEFGTLYRNLLLVANIFWKEFAVGDNIFDGWGGAYDLIYQDTNGKFDYLEDYSVFFRTFDFSSASNSIGLGHVLRYERRPDVSVVTTVLPDRLSFVAAKDIFAPDVSMKVNVGGSGLTMNSRIHISIIAVGKNGVYLPPLIQIDGLDQERSAKQTVFTDFDRHERLCVFFDAEHAKWLKDEARSYYKQHIKQLDRMA